MIMMTRTAAATVLMDGHGHSGLGRTVTSISVQCHLNSTVRYSCYLRLSSLRANHRIMVTVNRSDNRAVGLARSRVKNGDWAAAVT